MSEKHIHATLSRAEHAPTFGIGAGVIVMRGGKVLLQKRVRDGAWAIFGGIIRPDEAIEDAARRELYERTSLFADRLSLFGVYSGPEMRALDERGEEIPIVAVTYLCDDAEGEMRPQPGVAQELAWFSPEELPREVFFTDLFILRDLIRKLRGMRREGGEGEKQGA